MYSIHGLGHLFDFGGKNQVKGHSYHIKFLSQLIEVQI